MATYAIRSSGYRTLDLVYWNANFTNYTNGETI